MKAVILAGGRGTRLAEETGVRPKPMVKIGGKPILWHIMKIYSSHGIHDFVICCGYKGYMIKEYFANYFLHNSDVTFDMTTNGMTVHQNMVEPWRVTLVDTGDETATGGRLLRVRCPGLRRALQQDGQRREESRDEREPLRHRSGVELGQDAPPREPGACPEQLADGRAGVDRADLLQDLFPAPEVGTPGDDGDVLEVLGPVAMIQTAA